MLTNLIDKINEVLPQTQCTRCGYPSCLDYAKAIANKEAGINQCPPGGDLGIKELARLTNEEIIPLNPKHGEIKAKEIAIIDEDVCIGCTLCIKACPVDAIIGSNKMMHTVLELECTGCDLCIKVCPVDCITMVEDKNSDWNKVRSSLARERFEEHNKRKHKEQLEKEERLKKYANLLKSN